jgi:outer membrane receptor protein involved in Fe transport
VQNTNATVDTKNNVYEGALEVNVPLLKDIPVIEELSTTLAGRYIKYSSFSSVTAWKMGLDWHLNSSIRFRSTLSADIRAPNLNDLYQPVGVSSTGFTDLLIPAPNNVNGGQRLISQGTSTLTPEKARTVTVGLVLTPSFMPDFNFSVDYYQTKMTNAITGINYANTVVQNTCLASAPNYDNAFCKFVDRPITNPADPNYKTAANLPLQIYNRPFNSATQVTHGFDAQLNYRWEMLSGKFNLRHLISYQPVNETVSIPGTNPTWAVAPKLRQTTFLSYQTGDWTVSLQNQYMSSVSLVSTKGQVYADPKLKAYDVVDLTVSKKLESWVGAEVFLNISNLNNAKAPLVGDASGVPGLFYPTLGFYDDMGRFFTLGLKVGF